MEKEKITEESKIINAMHFIKNKTTKENIKNYSGKYRTPFDNKVLAIISSIISTCCMLFMDAFKFSHSFADWYMKFNYELTGDILDSSTSKQCIYSLFQYNLGSSESIDIFKWLTVFLLLMTIIFLLLNRAKFSLLTSSGTVIIMIITLFRESSYEAVAGTQRISPLPAYYILWAIVIAAFIMNILAFVKTKKVVTDTENNNIVQTTSNEVVLDTIPDETTTRNTSSEKTNQNIVQEYM